MSDNSFVPCRYHKMASVVNPSYDAIVDRSDFKKGQDKERAMRLLGDTGGTPTNGVYDFPDGKISKENTPTPLQLSLRTGRLDKADIDAIARVQRKAAQDEVKDNLDKKRQKDRETVEAARQSFIDSQTGFDPNQAKIN